MQLSQQRNKYLETTVQTATPAQLLLMLYDGAIRACRAGIDSIRNGKHADANTHLLKAQQIISEFSITLDRSSSVADNLLRLYEYFTSRLVEANVKKNIEPAEEVLGYLLEMKETWFQAAKQVTQSVGASNGSYTTASHTTVV